MSAIETDFNGDTSRRLLVRAGDMDWTTSPAGGVERKRYHRVGPPEAGQVTSLVRYLPGSRFPRHGHPEGEEILVLEGVFTDHRGDFPRGTWLASPEGFEHAPSSERGCLLFVKLRQYPGDRPEVALSGDDPAARWRPGAQGGSVLTLFDEPGFRDRITLERWPADHSQALFAAGGLELFLVAGAIRVDGEALDRHAFLRLPPGEPARATVEQDSLVWVKRDGVAALRSS
jgi:hypothetical protein